MKRDEGKEGDERRGVWVQWAIDNGKRKKGRGGGAEGKKQKREGRKKEL